MKRLIACSLVLLTAVCASAQLTIDSVLPDQAEPGTSGLLVTFTLPPDAPPTPPESVQPTSMTIGTISGTSMVRVSLTTATASFDIPAGEAEGAKDCSITFPSPGGDRVFTMSGGFTVGSAGAGEEAGENGPPSSGYNLFSPINSTETCLMDNDGNVINTWSSSYTPGNSVYLLEDGTLLRTANTGSTDFNEGGAGGRVEQFDWDGELIWAYDYDTAEHRQHHDVEVLPNGNILMIAWELKTSVEALAAGREAGLLDDGELWPDHIVEVAPTGSYGGEIVWEWHVWDHLTTDGASEPDKIDINFTQSGPDDGIADWQHINAIDYHTELDQILLSVRNFSEIWVIDHSTTTSEAAGPAGDLLYRWGNPAATGDSGDQQLYSQHDAKWIEDGLVGADNILIFNNGQGRGYSSVDEIDPGTYTSGLPLAAVWTYTNSVATNFYASRISGAQRLPNGNTLICEGTEKYAFEVTTDGDLVWNYTESAELFRFERYAPDFAGFDDTEVALPAVSYAIVDTAQDLCYNNSNEIAAPGTNDAFYGQDAQFDGHQPCYKVSPDRKTVYDYNTQLTWTQTPDWTGDGTIDINDKMTQSEAAAYVAIANAANFGGYSDWRLPSIKDVYSLMDFRGTDPMSDDTSTLVPFISSDYFAFAWGDTDADERTIDSQVATSTIHLDPVMGGMVDAMPGINIVDGRIKGYPVTKDFLVYLCRGNAQYGTNDYQDNGDGTVTDNATGLMWQQDDSGSGMLWADALVYAIDANATNLLGYSDWRLPNAKELQSIVDYGRAPTTTGSAAIDPVLHCTQISNEGGAVDWPWYFTGTTHTRQDGTGISAVYVCFGRAIGYWNSAWDDVHGPGSQRSDSKTVNPTGYTYVTDGWYFTDSPQGDATRWYNYVRLVRDAAPTLDSDGDGLTDDEETNIYGSNPGLPDSDGDGMADGDEVVAGTGLMDDTSYLHLGMNAASVGSATLYWPSVAGDRTYAVEGRTDLLSGTWAVLTQAGPTPPTNTTALSGLAGDQWFFRITVTDEPFAQH